LRELVIGKRRNRGMRLSEGKEKKRPAAAWERRQEEMRSEGM
jgi:hypothetical protein